MRQLPYLALGLALVFVAGCGSSNANVEVVDLNKVLTIFDETANQQRDGEAADADAAADAAIADASADTEPGGDAAPDEAELPEDDPNAANEFLVLFQANLNAAKLISTPITVAINEEGKIIGFKDDNADQTYGLAETQYFTIEIDQVGERLIATQSIPGVDTYRRDQSYSGRHYHSHSGFFWGYMVGSMGRRQNAYYSHASGRARPSYGAMSMSDRNYHSNAVSRARTASRARSSSARSRGGSGGLRGGK